MRRFALTVRLFPVFVALALPVLLAGGARACDLVQFGSPAADPERESVGRACPAAAAAAGMPSRTIHRLPALPVGVVTGDPEKDTFGYALLEDEE